MISIDRPLTSDLDLFGVPISNTGTSVYLYMKFLHPIYRIFLNVTFGQVYQHRSHLMISIDRPLTYDPDLLGLPIPNTENFATRYLTFLDVN